MYLAQQRMLDSHKAGLAGGEASQGVNTTLEQARMDPAKILEEMQELVSSESGAGGSSAMDSSPRGISDDDYEPGVPKRDWTNNMQAHLVDFLGCISHENE